MEEHAFIAHIGRGGHRELAQAEHQQQHALEREQGGSGGHRQQAAEPAQQGHGQQQGHADRLGPAEAEELLEAHAGEGSEEGAHRQDPEGLLPQGLAHGSQPHPLGEQQPPKAARQPEELKGPVQGPQVDVNPAQGQAEAGGHQQQPGPEQGISPLAPAEQQPQLADGHGGEGQAVAQHLAAVVVGDRVRPEHAVEAGISRAGEAAAGHGVGASAPMLAERWEVGDVQLPAGSRARARPMGCDGRHPGVNRPCGAVLAGRQRRAWPAPRFRGLQPGDGGGLPGSGNPPGPATRLARSGPAGMMPEGCSGNKLPK